MDELHTKEKTQFLKKLLKLDSLIIALKSQVNQIKI